MKRKCESFYEVDWKECEIQLSLKQSDLVAAWKSKNFDKVALLQDEIVRSFESRALAVRKVTTNDGKETPGTDGIIWNTPEVKMKGIKEIKNLSNYIAQPVRRVYIPKANGKLRPLGIPTMKDRAIQTLWTFALDPIAETESDSRSYGFRPYRSINDAAVYLKLVLGSYTATRRWILEGDISKFFDSVDHQWLIENIPMRKEILKQFLKAGFIEDKVFQGTKEGFPQGGPISPTIANIVLNGLQALNEPEFLTVRYADDFVVLGKTRESLDEIATPRIKEFLKIRGLALNLEKTLTVNVSEGFDFLGYHIREYQDKSRIKGTKKGILLVKPSLNKVKDFKRKLSNMVKLYMKKNRPLFALVTKLNETLRGWAEHYCISTAKKIFVSIGRHMWIIVWKMLRKKHFRMPRRKLIKKYFSTKEGNRWIFTCPQSDNKGVMTLYQIAYTPIKRHLVCKDLNSFELENKGYFLERVSRKSRHTILLNKKATPLLRKQKGICLVCECPLLRNEELEVHHIKPRKLGGDDKLKNLTLLHKACHKQVTHSKSEKLRALWKVKNIIT